MSIIRHLCLSLFILIFSVIGINSFGQTYPTGLPTTGGDSTFARFGYMWVKQLLILQAGDTAIRPKYDGSLRLWANPAADTAIWAWFSPRWIRLTNVNGGGGSGGISQVVAGACLTQINDSTLAADTNCLATRWWVDSLINNRPDSNFANADLTFTGDRYHDQLGHSLTIGGQNTEGDEYHNLTMDTVRTELRKNYFSSDGFVGFERNNTRLSQSDSDTASYNYINLSSGGSKKGVTIYTDDSLRVESNGGAYYPRTSDPTNYLPLLMDRTTGALVPCLTCDFGGGGSSGISQVVAGLGLANLNDSTLFLDTASSVVLSRQRAAATYQPLNSSWLLTGNATVDSATRYLGTSDLRPLRLFTNGQPRMIINSFTGNIGVGTQAPTTDLDITKTTNSGAVVTNIKNNSTTGEAGIVVRNDSYYTALEVFGSNWSAPALRNTALFTAQSGITNLGFATLGSGSISFRTNTPSGTTNERLTITSTGEIGINTTSPNSSAQLDVQSTTKGALIPRMTQTQRDAIASPATGLMVYNTTTNIVDWYNGSVWVSVGLYYVNGNFSTLFAGGYTGAGSNNLFFGSNSGISNTTGSDNISIGSRALFSNSISSKNIAIGRAALRQYVTPLGGSNISIGDSSSAKLTDGTGNVVIGVNALREQTGSNRSGWVAVGADAFRSQTSSGSGTAVGSNAGVSSTGTLNTYIGSEAASLNSSGNSNTAVGDRALGQTTTVSNVTAIGVGANFSGGANSSVLGLAANRGNTGINAAVVGINSLGSFITNVSNKNCFDCTVMGGSSMTHPDSSANNFTGIGARVNFNANPLPAGQTRFGGVGNFVAGAYMSQIDTGSSNTGIIGYNNVGWWQSANNGQTQMVNGTNARAATFTSSAALEVRSTTRGVLLASMSSANFSAISSPAIGLHATDATTGRLRGNTSAGILTVAYLDNVPTTARYAASGTGAATTITFAHGLSGITSSSITVVTAKNAASGGFNYVTTDATNINIVYTVAPPSGTNNLSFDVYIKP